MESADSTMAGEPQVLSQEIRMILDRLYNEPENRSLMMIELSNFVNELRTSGVGDVATADLIDESVASSNMADIDPSLRTDSPSETLQTPLESLSLISDAHVDHTSSSPQPPIPHADLNVRKRKSLDPPVDEHETSNGTVDTPERAEQPAVKKPRKASQRISATRKLSNPAQLSQVSVAMSASYDVSVISNIRSTFCDALLQIPKPPGSRYKVRPGQDATKLFDHASATQLTQFFFEDTMGAAGAEQLFQFVCDYSPSSEGKQDAGAAARLGGLATDTRAPPLVQLFCASLSVELSRERDEHSAIGHVSSITRAISTLQSYRDLCKHIDGNHTEMWTYIQARLGSDSVAELKAAAKTEKETGVGHASIALNILVALTGVKKAVISSKIDRARAIELLVRSLGDGFMLVMPPNSIAFLKDMGVGRIGPACDLLLQLCPYIPEFVQLLEKFVWKPYLDGVSELPINVDVLEPWSGGEIVFLDRLKSATEQYRHSSQLLLQDMPGTNITERVTEVADDSL